MSVCRRRPGQNRCPPPAAERSFIQPLAGWAFTNVALWFGGDVPRALESGKPCGPPSERASRPIQPLRPCLLRFARARVPGSGGTAQHLVNRRVRELAEHIEHCHVERGKRARRNRQTATNAFEVAGLFASDRAAQYGEIGRRYTEALAVACGAERVRRRRQV